jgi:hypothetical protein
VAVLPRGVLWGEGGYLVHAKMLNSVMSTRDRAHRRSLPTVRTGSASTVMDISTGQMQVEKILMGDVV